MSILGNRHSLSILLRLWNRKDNGYQWIWLIRLQSIRGGFDWMHWMRIDKSDKKCKMIIEFKMIKFEFKTMERRERICSLKTAEITQPSIFSVFVLFD